jgi:uncharacterized repeat protein (TIGR01451 family)
MLPLATAAAVAAFTLACLGSSTAAALPAAGPPVAVELDRTQAAVALGQTLKFTTKVSNPGEKDVSGAIAHLNIVAVDPGVYVDPEDWSGERTQYLDPLGGAESDPLEWELQAVTSGRFVVYVVITFDQAAGEVVASKALRLEVAPERTLEASGLVPIAAGVPGIVVLLMGVVMVRRRRHRSTPTSSD